MARRSAADAAETRRRIVARSVDLGAEAGLESMSLGRLADDLGMSKSGVLRHFASKEQLQLAAVDTASAEFAEQVVRPAFGEPPGLTRLLAWCDRWVAFVTGRREVGGCFFTAAAADLDSREGRVRDAVADALGRWEAILADEVARAVELGELPEGTDRQQVVFEIAGTIQGLNQRLLLRGDRRAPARARRAVRRILGVD